MPEFVFQPLDTRHDRAGFACGIGALDDFLKTKARKENEQGYCRVFVMVDAEYPTVIAGYYTLSAHHIEIGGIDEKRRKKFPKYPVVPTILLGRMARSLVFRGTGAGELILMDALKRALASSGNVGAYAVVVDAVNDDAYRFYRIFEFLPVVGSDDRLYLPMETIRKLDLGD